MQRTNFITEPKLINDLTLNARNEKLRQYPGENEGKSKELKKFFNGFKRAMKFGPLQKLAWS